MLISACVGGCTSGGRDSGLRFFLRKKFLTIGFNFGIDVQRRGRDRQLCGQRIDVAKDSLLIGSAELEESGDLHRAG